MRLLNAERTTIVSSLNAETRAVSSSQEGGAAFLLPCAKPEHQNEPMYRALRRQGMSKARAARISNAARFKAATLGTLEAYVSASDYAPPVAQALASLIPSCLHAGRELGPWHHAHSGQPVQRAWPLRAVRRRAERQEAAEGPEARQNARAAPGRARATAAANRASVTSALAEADASLRPTGVASVLGG